MKQKSPLPLMLILGAAAFCALAGDAGAVVGLSDAIRAKAFFQGYLIELYNNNKLLLSLWIIVIMALCGLFLGLVFRATTGNRRGRDYPFGPEAPQHDDDDEDEPWK